MLYWLYDFPLLYHIVSLKLYLQAPPGRVQEKGENKMITSYLKSVLSYLGPEYRFQEIDLEDCIYRKINSSYDIEISGAYKKGNPITVYVWDISKDLMSNAHIVETVGNIKTPEELKSILNSIVSKYSQQ